MQDLRPILRLPIELRLKIATHVARPVNITEALQSCCTQDYFRSLSNDHSALFKVSGFVGLKSRYRKAFKSTNPVVFVRRQDLIGPRYVRMKWRMLRHPLIQLTGPQLVMTAYGIGPRIDSQISPLLDEMTTRHRIAADTGPQPSLATLLKIETPLSRLSELTLVFDTDIVAFNQALHRLACRTPELRLRKLRVCFELDLHEHSECPHPRQKYLADNLLDSEAPPQNRDTACAWVLRSFRKFEARLSTVRVYEYELSDKQGTSRTVFTRQGKSTAAPWTISDTLYGERKREARKFEKWRRMSFRRCEWELIARWIVAFHLCVILQFGRIAYDPSRPDSLRLGLSFVLVISVLPLGFWFIALYNFALQ